MRAYSATVGATDGNIIAAIITSHTPRNQPRAPSAVPGPSSIPAMRSAVDHHATAASANSSAISPSRARAAAKAGASPRPRMTSPAALTSGGPGEVRRGERRLALVLDPERADAGARGARDRQLRAGRVEDAGELRGLARGRAERDDVLDLEVDRVADPHAVAQAVLPDLDRRALYAEVLADQRAQRLHRPAELAAEHAAQLLRLLVGGVRVDEDAQPPV